MGYICIVSSICNVYAIDRPLPVTGSADANSGCWAIARYFAVEGVVGDCGEQDNVGSLLLR